MKFDFIFVTFTENTKSKLDMFTLNIINGNHVDFVFLSRNVGSNAIFTIFASGGLPARLQSQRQLQRVLLT